MFGRVKTPEEWSEITLANKIKWGEYRDGGRRYNVPPQTTHRHSPARRPKSDFRSFARIDGDDSRFRV